MPMSVRELVLHGRAYREREREREGVRGSEREERERERGICMGVNL